LAGAWIADVKSAFTQGLKGQRTQRLFASPPAGGFPGEDDDILIEVLAEVYGLITGPPAWRKSLFTDFKSLNFKRHPLARRLALMYKGPKNQLSGLVLVETDDLLGGGTGDQFSEAIATLRRKYNSGKWNELMDNSHEYGERTLRQHQDFSFAMSMARYLKERA